MLEIKKFCFNPFGENTYLIYDTSSREAIVVDPGMWNDEEKNEFDEFVGTHSLTIKQIVNTHLHVDHCFGANYVKDKYGVDMAGNVGDSFLGEIAGTQAAKYGLKTPMSPVAIDVPLKDGDIIKIGNEELNIITVPGHSPGGLAIYSRNGKFVITGDSLFRSAVGRTDLPGGNYAQLVKNVKEKLLTLPDDTTVYPGHEDLTTVAREKVYNPFL